MHKFFRPQSVAVLGDFHSVSTPAEQVVDQLLRNGYTGKLYPVSGKGKQVCGLEMVRKLSDLPHRVDLYIIPVDDQSEIALARVTKHGGQRVLLVGRYLSEAQRQRVGKSLAASKVKLIGPTTLLSHPGFSFHLSNTIPQQGGIALFGRGDMAAAILSWAHASSVGLSHAVEIGTSGVDEAELLNYLSTQEDARVVAGFFTSVHEPRAFLEAVRLAAARKPTVIYLGVDDISHRQILETELRLRGAVVAEELEDFLMLLDSLSLLRIPISGQTSLLGLGPESLGMATYATAALTVAPPSAAARAVLRRVVPSADLSDSVGLHFSDAPRIAAAVRVLLEDESSDALIVSLVEGGYDMVQAALEVSKAAKRSGKSVVVSVVGGEQARLASQILFNEHIPVVGSLERAMQLLGRVIDAAEHAKRPIRYSKVPSISKHLPHGAAKNLNVEEVLQSYGLVIAPKGAVEMGTQVSIELWREPKLGPLVSLDGMTLLAPLEDGVAKLLVSSLPPYMLRGLGGEAEQLAVTLDRLSRLIWEMPELQKLSMPSLSVTAAGLIVEQSDLTVGKR